MTTQKSFLVDGFSNTLRLPEAAAPVPAKEPSPHSDAEAFDAAHPWFLLWVAEEGRRRKRVGHKSWGMKAAFEEARPKFAAKFGVFIPGVGKVGLNNNLTAPLTVLLLKRAPDLVGFFRTRAGTDQQRDDAKDAGKEG